MEGGHCSIQVEEFDESRHCPIQVGEFDQCVLTGLNL